MAADSQSDACFDADDVQSLMSGGLHPERRERLLHHAAGCDACRQRLRDAGLAMPPRATGNPSPSSAIPQDAIASAGSAPATGRQSIGAESAPSNSSVPAEAIHKPAPPVATIHLAATIEADVRHVSAAQSQARTELSNTPPSARGAGSQSRQSQPRQLQPGPPQAADRLYPFLDPPQGPDELGRLGDYRILRVLGEGGMGIVFEADDVLLGRRVAIKVLRQGDFDETHSRRFLQEARLAASLPHDRIVTIYQVSQRPCPFIVMELLAGETLDARLKREGWLPLPEALRIAREVAEGLEAAHEKRLVHRDIKPANVFLENARGGPAGGRVKVLDFGVARPIVSGENLTMQGRIVGTPGYMSPEQACGFSPDGRSDLFALGCLIYAMLVGDSPFQRDSDIDTLHAVVRDDPTPIREKRPQLPESVALLVGSLLSKSPHDRPRDARSVVEAIRRIERDSTDAKSSRWSLRRGKPKSPSSQHKWSRNKKLGWGAASGLATIAAAALIGAVAQWNNFRTNSGSNGPPANTTGTGIPSDPSAAAAATAPSAADSAATPPPDGGKPPIKVGIVLSLSGVMRNSEEPILDALLLAIEEVNAAGGLLDGRAVQALRRNGQSRDAKFEAEAKDLIEREKVVTLFGCWRSPSRKLVEAVCREHDNLLVYPLTYEGLEESPYVIYMGGAPNQQLLPAAKYAYAALNKRKYFLVGAEGVYSYAAHAILGDELKSLGASVVGDEHVKLGSSHFDQIAEKIKASGADCIMSTVSGSGNFAFFHCLQTAGIDTARVPTISFRLTEEDLRALETEHIVGAYAAWSYFQSGSSENNRAFVQRFRDRYGPQRVVNDPMEAAYNGLRLWAQAVQAAGSDRPAEIRQAFVRQQFAAPEGLVRISPENRHAARLALIGQVDESLEFHVVFNSPKPIPPEPFPASRSKAQWEAFLKDLERRIVPAENPENSEDRAAR